MTAPLPNADAWTRARDRYLEDLTDTERAMFNKASIEEILYDASAAEKKHGASSKSRALSKKLEPLVSAIDQYGEAMDVYVNAYPLALSPLWGSIRVVLHIASEFQKYFNKLVDMFANIGDVLPRFKIYEKLFSNHEVLIQSLSKVYVDIIEFCTDAKKIFRDGKRATGLRAALKLTWKPFEQQFGNQLEHFRQHRKNVEKEAGLAHMIEAADSRALTLANQMQVEKDRELDERRQLLKILSTVDYVAKHQKVQEARYEGTGDWFLDNETYLLWKEADASVCLCCTGIPGSGKTFLASRVIDDLLRASSHTDLHTIYYYCDYADIKTVQAQHVLEAILKQLLLKSVVPETVKCQLKNTYIDEMRSAGARHLREYICSAIAASSGVCIVVDGLDECETGARQDVMTLLESLFNLGQPTVKVLVFCREDDQILTFFDAFSRIQVSESMLATDIEAFITGSVKSRIRSRRLKLKDPTLEYNIVADLIAKAQGMFLWVHFQLEELCEATSDTHIRQILRDLPKGLGETYGRILEKLGKSNNKFTHEVFRWIACAQRPLHLGELKEAVSHEVNDRSWHDATDIDGNRLIRSCGALVCIDEDDQTVRFAHHTVLQFLLSLGKVPSYHFSLTEANRHVGEMCVIYLCFSDFETAVTRRLPDHSIRDAPVFQPGGVAGISSLLGVGRLMSHIVRLFHAGKSDSQMNRVDIDYERYMGLSRKPMEPVVPALAKKYLLLEYVVANWDWHTKSLEESSSVIWNSFRRLAMHKELAFDFRKWGVNEHSAGPYGCIGCNAEVSKSRFGHLPFMSLINYAAFVGHVPLLRLFESERDGIASLPAYLAHEDPYELIRSACCNGQGDCVRYLCDRFRAYYPPANTIGSAIYRGHEAFVRIFLREYPEILEVWDGRSELRSAIVSGRPAILESLLDGGIPFDVRNQEDLSAIDVADDNNHNAVIAMLIDKGLLSRHDLVRYVHSPLHFAAREGDISTVQAFLQAGKSVETCFGLNDCTTLHEAAKSGHSNVIEVLLDHKANIEAVDAISWTALHWAAFNGHVNAVRMLCQRGANIVARTSGFDETPLHLSTQAGNIAVIRELVKWGADVNTTYRDIGTSLDHAMIYGRKDAEAALRKLGAKTYAELQKK